MDRIAGLQDRMVFLGLSWAQTIDRITGLLDLQDRV
jgi:hypothetical protein